jgi:hypothetical protein
VDDKRPPRSSYGARCSEICPALTMQHSKPFRLLQQGAFWAGRHRAKRRLARLRKELCASVALFTRVCGKGFLRTSLFRRLGSNTLPVDTFSNRVET